MAREYFKNPEETAKAFTEDGWFRTGDIGEIDANGHVKVIDRVKNLVKMLGGEYIALEKLEAVYRGSAYVNNILVYGDHEHPRAIAVVTPNEKPLADLAHSLGVDGNAHSIHVHPKVREAVFKDLVAVGKKAGLTGLEIISGVALVDDEWTPANVSFSQIFLSFHTLFGPLSFCFRVCDELASSLAFQRRSSLTHRHI